MVYNMVTLYHYHRSTCSQKVRLALSENDVSWTGIEIDLFAGENKSEEFLRLSPKGQVPVLLWNDKVLLESSNIIYFLDEEFSGLNLQPCSAWERHLCREWVRKSDELAHLSVGVITLASAIRAVQLTQDEHLVKAEINKISDPVSRSLRLSVFEKGTSSPEFTLAKRKLQSLLSEIEGALLDAPYLSGNNYSLADVAILPYVLRLEDLGLRNKMGTATISWLSRCKERNSYADAVLKFKSDEDAVLYQQAQRLLEDQFT